MAKQFKFSFKGVLLLAAVFLFVVLLFLTSFVYRNLKGVEQNVLNLKEQLKTANQKLQNSDETKLDPQELFDLATKDWAKYENFDRGLKFKYPAEWGKILENTGERKFVFENFRDLKFSFVEYEAENKFINSEIRQLLWQTEIGDCSRILVDKLTGLDNGQVHNCLIRDNLAGQKYLIYRYSVQKEEEFKEFSLAIFPREAIYLQWDLPKNYLQEIDLLFKGVVFL